MKKLLFLILLASAGAVHAQGMMKSVGGASSTGGSSGGENGDLVDAGDKYHFYVGADYQFTTLSVSDPSTLHNIPTGDYYSRMWDVRAGYRLFKVIGLEADYGFKAQDAAAPDKYSSSGYWGVFAVPTANVFGLFELGFPIGWVHSNITAPVGSVPVGASLHSIAYGGNIEVPIREFWHALPDLRLTGGGMVYYQRSDAREYGYHLGLRYDFGFGGNAPPVEPAPASTQVVPEAPAPAAPPPPPPPPCQPPAEGQHADLSGCKTGDTIVLHGVNFDTAKATLTANAKTLLDEVADALNKRTDIKVEIDGYTDNRGGDAYNQKLSDHRAASVKQYLVGKGVDAGRMSTKGFGKENPVGDNSTDEGREANRRVELKVTDASAPAAAPAADSGTPPPADNGSSAAPAPAGDNGGAAPPSDSGSAPAPASAPADSGSAPPPSDSSGASPPS